MKETRTLRTVDNALRLMTHLALPPGSWGVSQLSRELGLGKSVIHSLLQTLKARDFVEQDADLTYRLGYQVLALGGAVQGQMGIRRVSLPEMHHLAEETQEAVYLMVLWRQRGVLLERVEPEQHVRVTMEVGQSGHLHAGGSNKIIMAFLTQAEIDRYILETGLRRFTPHTITDPELLREQLARIREHGYAYSEQESFEGIAGLAAPIFDHQGKVVASIGVAGIIQRLKPRLDEMVPHVVEAAGRISRALGHRVQVVSEYSSSGEDA